MPPQTATLVLPFAAAVIYVFSALLLKRSSELAVGIWRTTFVSNMVVGLLFSSLWLLGGKEVSPALLWQPGIIAICLFLGQILQFLALEKGDISVAVPVFGLKVVLVAFFTPLMIGDAVGIKLWCAAFFSVLGITFFHKKNQGARPKNIGITLLSGGLGAACFATFDVLVQKWGPSWGPGRLLPVIFWMNALLSFGLIPFFRAPLSAIRTEAWRWLLLGGALLGTQSILFTSTIAMYGAATAANIIYASRGLLTVVGVWLIGHWFGNTERHQGASVMRWRMCGAALMLSAIVLVMMK